MRGIARTLSECLVAVGHTNREAAERPSISEHTVKFHMRGTLDKLHLRNRTEVTAWAAVSLGESCFPAPEGAGFHVAV